MSIRIPESEWRQKRWEWHGEAVYDDLKKLFKDKRFNINDVASVPALSHLADRTAYDNATGICRELEMRRKLRRQGQLMFLTDPLVTKIHLPSTRRKKYATTKTVKAKAIKTRTAKNRR